MKRHTLLILGLIATIFASGCTTIPNKNLLQFAGEKDTAVVCIGMQNSKKYGNCPGAQLDATRMDNLLKKYTDNRTLLISQQATKAAVINAMQQACRKDLAIIFYSGHGGHQKQKVTANTTFIEPSGYDSFLCLYDAPMLDDEIWAIISNAKGRVVFIADACHSATMYRESPIFMNFESSLIKHFSASKGKGPRIFAVGGCGDLAYSYGGDDGGMLTNKILEAYKKERTYEKVFKIVKKDYNLMKTQTVTTTAIGESFSDFDIFR